MKISPQKVVLAALALAAFGAPSRADLGPKGAAATAVRGDALARSRDSSPTWLGVAMEILPPELAVRLPIDPGTGLIVNFVLEGSPAALAGLEKGDILARIDDRMLVTPKQLQTLITKRKPGDYVEVTFIRRGEKRKVKVMLMAHEPLEKEPPDRRTIIVPPRRR